MGYLMPFAQSRTLQTLVSNPYIHILKTNVWRRRRKFWYLRRPKRKFPLAERCPDDRISPRPSGVGPPQRDPNPPFPCFNIEVFVTRCRGLPETCVTVSEQLSGCLITYQKFELDIHFFPNVPPMQQCNSTRPESSL